MRSGHESQTAVMVCAARAAAHGRIGVAAFSDPTALALLPQDARQRVERFRSGVPPRSLRERVGNAVLEGRSQMMVARTVAIDAAIRTAAFPQVVILGAGLDGRAWRMPELAEVTVFEVDHPASQREKQVRGATLRQTARDVRFVPVDFTCDRLEDALAAAGHDPARQTTWVWEGVVMYLERADIEATLRVVEARSAPGSRLVVMYQSPSIIRQLGGFVLGWLGEPFRSSFTADAMRMLLAGRGLAVLQDDDLATIATGVSADFAEGARLLKDVRIAIAERR
ncbi:MAG: class I SAM-dependent methyltransferase [Coriobacteriia bacterium]|nr:class I SAM-dependent methyltransferase [Coriobacteriia bacterium]